jgi:hypothetical protein
MHARRVLCVDPHNAHHNRAVASGADHAKRFNPRLRFMVLLCGSCPQKL